MGQASEMSLQHAAAPYDRPIMLTTWHPRSLGWRVVAGVLAIGLAGCTDPTPNRPELSPSELRMSPAFVDAGDLGTYDDMDYQGSKSSESSVTREITLAPGLDPASAVRRVLDLNDIHTGSVRCQASGIVFISTNDRVEGSVVGLTFSFSADSPTMTVQVRSGMENGGTMVSASSQVADDACPSDLLSTLGWSSGEQ